MNQTPAHEMHNPDLLALVPKTARRVVEVGSSSGALAKAYKAINPGCAYTGIEIDSNYTRLSARFCDRVVGVSVEDLDEAAFADLFPSDCWIFGDTLEHLKDPWRILKRIREGIDPTGSVVACIPNAQHWSVQAKLCRGDFRYEDSGLLDRTHLRWFTKTTIVELFASCGFRIAEGVSRIFDEPGRDRVLTALGTLAIAVGGDPEEAKKNATPLQWVVRAIPA